MPEKWKRENCMSYCRMWNYKRFKRFAQLSFHNNSTQARKAFYCQEAIKNQICRYVKLFIHARAIYYLEIVLNGCRDKCFPFIDQLVNSLTYCSNNSQWEQKSSRKAPLSFAIFDTSFTLSVDKLWLERYYFGFYTF